eukprot:345875-Chlamydomonas_euryale.AAC.1
MHIRGPRLHPTDPPSTHTLPANRQSVLTPAVEYLAARQDPPPSPDPTSIHPSIHASSHPTIPPRSISPAAYRTKSLCPSASVPAPH